jgi:hypothetical protein
LDFWPFSIFEHKVSAFVASKYYRNIEQTLFFIFGVKISNTDTFLGLLFIAFKPFKQ